MAYQMDDYVSIRLDEMLIDTGLDGLSGALTSLPGEVMRLGRSRDPQAQPWERCAQWRGYRSQEPSSN